MSVTPADKLAGLLPVVVSGGRPKLVDRPTRRHLPALAGVTAAPVWLVRDDEAPGYERDHHELVTFPRAEAEAYAAARWTATEPWAPGMATGVFPAREWACRLAEDRGHWAALVLDDNVRRLVVFMNRAATRRLVDRHGGLALFADILAAVTLATNARMAGAMLSAANPASEPDIFARPGFPYSVYTEVVGPGREDWYGPTEEDIFHAYQYGANASSDTAAVVVPLRYLKDHTRQSGGMRPLYAGHTRSVGLQRMAPEMARLGVHRGHANGAGEPRVFHKMIRGAIRTPLVITDPGLFAQAQGELAGLADEFTAEYAADVAAKVTSRAARARP
jgi:hypothetical protein